MRSYTLHYTEMKKKGTKMKRISSVLKEAIEFKLGVWVGMICSVRSGWITPECLQVEQQRFDLMCL